MRRWCPRWPAGSLALERARQAGDPVSGITIHLVDEDYDHGLIFGQAEVPVLPGDTVETLTERVQTRERAFFVETLARIERGELDLDRLAR